MSAGHESGNRGRWLVIGILGGAAILAVLASLVRRPAPLNLPPGASTQPVR